LAQAVVAFAMDARFRSGMSSRDLEDMDNYVAKGKKGVAGLRRLLFNHRHNKTACNILFEKLDDMGVEHTFYSIFNMLDMLRKHPHPFYEQIIINKRAPDVDPSKVKSADETNGWNFTKTGDQLWGEECPIRIADGDGGAESNGLSTVGLYQHYGAHLGQAEAAAISGRDAAVALFEPCKFTPVFDLVLVGFALEHRRGFLGMYDALRDYGKDHMQTHTSWLFERPILCVHIPPTQPRFVPGAWYFGRHKTKHNQLCVVVQVLSALTSSGKKTKLLIRAIDTKRTTKGRRVSDAQHHAAWGARNQSSDVQIQARLGAVIDGLNVDKKVGEVYRPTDAFEVKVEPCACCAPPSEFLRCNRIGVCAARGRVVARGRALA
jgi:hypothetical protein